MNIKKTIAGHMFAAGVKISAFGLDLLASNLIRNTYGVRYGAAHIIYSTGCILCGVAEDINGRPWNLE
jgi:hypothetical protein